MRVRPGRAPHAPTHLQPSEVDGVEHGGAIVDTEWPRRRRVGRGAAREVPRGEADGRDGEPEGVGGPRRCVRGVEAGKLRRCRVGDALCEPPAAVPERGVGGCNGSVAAAGTPPGTHCCDQSVAPARYWLSRPFVPYAAHVSS